MDIIIVMTLAMIFAEIMFILIWKKSKKWDGVLYLIGLIFRIFTLLVLLAVDRGETSNKTVSLILVQNTMIQMLIQVYVPAVKKHSTQLREQNKLDLNDNLLTFDEELDKHLQNKTKGGK